MSRLKINKEGDRFWYNKKNLLHREDGPASEWNDGDKWWYLNGKYYTKKDYNAKIRNK